MDAWVRIRKSCELRLNFWVSHGRLGTPSRGRPAVNVNKHMKAEHRNPGWYCLSTKQTNVAPASKYKNETAKYKNELLNQQLS